MESTDGMSDIAYFSEPDASVFHRLACLGKSLRVHNGTVLFREGDLHDQFYVIRSGNVALEMCLQGRGCTQLLTIGPGEMLAWSSVVGDSRMTATAIARGDVEAWCMSGKDLANACDQDHEFGYQVMRWLAKALSRRLFATRLQLLDMFLMDAGLGKSS